MRFELMALAAVAAGLAGSLSAQPVIQAVPERPRIITDGYGEVKTPPDLAIIDYTVRGEGSRSDDALRTMTRTAARIEAALHKIDGGAEPLTGDGDVSIAPVKSDDCKERESPQLSTGPCAILGFVATQELRVRTAAVKDAGTMVGLVSRGGGIDARLTDFRLRDPRAAQREATAAALADAASKASTIASASRVALGPILSVSTVGRSAEEIAAYAPRAQANAAPEPEPVAVSLNPEPITTTANVTVTYAIGR
jgi:uncharacterized protein YggE